MPHFTRSVLLLTLAVFGLAETPLVQSTQKNANGAGEQRNNNSQEIGKSYALLRPEQEQLLDLYVSNYNATTGSNIDPQAAYDGARLSVRTTFDAVTHALLNATLSDAQGTSLGRAIDLVEAVDEVMGEQAGVGGDRQFRVYVYLKPGAVDLLSKSQEFFHDRDNTVYHKGFPICYRLKNGPPSIQFSISRDHRMSDIDVDYRSSKFPQALLNGHLTAANSDVRAGNNLDRHDNRWAGLNGWWRDVFSLLGLGNKPPKENATESLGQIPLNPPLKANQGLDQSVHEFLRTWVVTEQPNISLAYFSRRSYACLETLAVQNRAPVPPGMLRLRTAMAMKEFSDKVGAVNFVKDVFEAASTWSQQLKDVKNAYASEFRLVSVPVDMVPDEECIAATQGEAAKMAREKYYASAFRGTVGETRNKVMSLLWTQEGAYWKIVAIRVEDSSTAGILPNNATAAEPKEQEPQTILGDPGAVAAITAFYQSWLVSRDASRASRFTSPRSFACINTPEQDAKSLPPITKIRSALDHVLARITPASELTDVMSGLQPVNELLRPVEHKNSDAFAIMAVPDQKAGSFLCQNRGRTQEPSELRPADAKYGTYYISASQFNFVDEESPGLVLLWTKDGSDWEVVAWAVEVP